MNCPLCGESLAARGFFCKSCAAQVRCKNCRDLLEPAAIACIECGTRVGLSPEPDSGTALVSAGSHPLRNTLSYQETENNRTFQASLSDTAIQGLGEVLGDFFVQRGAARTPSQIQPLVKSGLALKPKEPDGPGNGNKRPEIANPHAGNPPADLDRILRIFHVSGETLELTDNRLKAKSGSDFLRRLTYLLLYAHELHDHSSVPYQELKAALQSGKAWDSSGNAQRWIRKKVGLADGGDDSLKLNAKGREEAIHALDDALDSSIQDEWNPDRKTPRKSGPRKKA